MKHLPRGIPLLMVALLLVACGGGEEAAPKADPRKPVQLAPASAVVLPLRGTAPAQVVSGNASELSSDVSARVAEVHADVGSTVAAGQPILSLDDADYRLAQAQADARLAAAAASLDLAEQRLRRARALVQQQFVSEDAVLALEAERDGARAQRDVAQADQRVATRNVAKTRITAPFAGVVTERFAQVGTLAGAGTPLVRFIEIDGLEVQASVQADQAEDLRQASELRFTSQGREYPVILSRLAAVVEATSRTQVARLVFAGDPAIAGSSGTLSWTAPGQRLPADLLVQRDGELGYFTATGGRATFVAVPGAQAGRAFPVQLEAATALVVRGQNALNDGDPVMERAQAGQAAAEVAAPPDDAAGNAEPR